MALKHKLMLAAIGAVAGALLQGCTADKHPSAAETALANAANPDISPAK
jgi:hypothetical protein